MVKRWGGRGARPGTSPLPGPIGRKPWPARIAWAPGERRKARNADGMEARGEAAQLLDGIVVELDFAAAGFKRADAAARAKYFFGIGARECVARNRLATFNAFEQERIFRGVGDAEIRADGSEQIGGEFLIHRDEISLAREF